MTRMEVSIQHVVLVGVDVDDPAALASALGAEILRLASAPTVARRLSGLSNADHLAGGPIRVGRDVSDGEVGARIARAIGDVVP